MEPLTSTPVFGGHFVLIFTGFGTGKTMLMVHKAKELAQKGDQVSFLVVVEAKRKIPTFLTDRLKKDFKGFGTINVREISVVNLTPEFLRESIRKE